MRLQQHIRQTTVLTNTHTFYVWQSQNTGCIWRIERKPLCKSPLCLLCLSILKTTAVEPAICTPSWTSLPAWRPESYALSLFFISFSSSVFSHSDCNSMYWIQVKTEPPLPCIQSPFHSLLLYSYIIFLSIIRVLNCSYCHDRYCTEWRRINTFTFTNFLLTFNSCISTIFLSLCLLVLVLNE